MRIKHHLERARAFEAVLLTSQVILAGSSVLVARTAGAPGRGLLTSVTVWTQVLGWFGVFSLEKALMVMSRPPRSEFEPSEGLNAAGFLIRRFSPFSMAIGIVIGGSLLHSWSLGLMIAVGVPLTAYLELWYGYLLATGKRAAYLCLRVLQPVLYAMGIALVALFGSQLSLRRQVLAMTTGFLISLGLPSGAFFLFSRSGRRAPRQSSKRVRAAMFAFARGAQLASILQYLNARLDLLALPLKVSAANLGLYAVGAAPAQVLIYFGSAGSFRGLTGESKGRDLPALAAIGSLATLVALCSPVVIPYVFGAQFRDSVPIAQVLSLGAFFGFALQNASGRLLGNSRTRALTLAQGLGAICFLLGFVIADTIIQVAWASVISYLLSLLIAELFLSQERVLSFKPTLPQVAVLCDYYLPGFRAGGPIRSISGLVSGLGEELDFHIVTRDRDLGTRLPYPNLTKDAAMRLGHATVTYLRPSALNWRGLRRTLMHIPHQVLYLNSFFSVELTIKPLVLRKLGLLPRDAVVVLAPRGEFSPAALNLGRGKKRIFIALSRLLGLYRGILWQASTPEEERLIREVMGTRLRIRVAEVIVAGDIADWNPAASSNREEKVRGTLRIVLVARIARMKNQLFALQLLKEVQGDVVFDLFGPIDDAEYFSLLREVMATLPSNIRANYRGELPHDEVVEVMSQYDLFCLPTLGENFGHVVREALSAGCPVLISDRTPWHGLSAAGAGWDLPLEAPHAFVTRLRECVDLDAQDHERMRRSAVTYSQQFSEEDISLDQNRQLFGQALELYQSRVLMTAGDGPMIGPPQSL